MRSDAMIFQPYVSKAFEARVTWFSDYPVAVRLNSQEHPRAKIDWRVADPSDLHIEQIDIPLEVADRCKSLMSALDIVFCCIDFIVTLDGKWIFLELNQMGQFLWIEELNPDIRMLEPFLQLLILGPSQVSSAPQFSVNFHHVRDAAYERRDFEIGRAGPCAAVTFYDENKP